MLAEIQIKESEQYKKKYNEKINDNVNVGEISNNDVKKLLRANRFGS